MTTRPVKVWDGTSWVDVGVQTPDLSGYITKASNLADVSSVSTSRTNLGLGTAAVKDTGTGSTNVILGNDSRLTDTRTPTDGTVTDAKIATTLSPSKITGTAVVTGDARLTDARTPTAHKTTHATGGTDALSPSDIGAVATTRTVSAGTGLTGGGDLSADRTLAIASGGVTATQLASDSVTLAKLADNSSLVVAATAPASPKIGTVWVDSSATVDTMTWPVGSSQIADSAVTTSKLAAGAVTAAKSSLTAADVGASWTLNKTGIWTSGNHGSLATTIPSEARLLCSLFPVTRSITLDRIAINIATSGSAGALLRLGIYKADANCVDYTKVLDAGTVDGTQAAGDYSITINQALTAGLHLLAVAVQGGASTRPSIRVGTAGAGLAYLMGDATQATLTQNQNPVALFVDSITGALPTSITPGRGSQAPIIPVRIA